MAPNGGTSVADAVSLYSQRCEPTLGEFPSSVAYSPRLKIACVINGGTKPPTNHTRPIDPSRQQYDPSRRSPNTISDIVFNPSQSALFVTIKGTPSTNTPGTIYIYPVENGTISTTPIISRPELFLNFSLTFLDSDSRTFITGPAFGAAFLSISPSYEATVTKKLTFAGQGTIGAIYWSVFSPRFKTIFLLDAMLSPITTVDAHTGTATGTTPQRLDQNGSFDSAASLEGQYLYVLKHSARVNVLDLDPLGVGESPVEVQSLDLSMFGARVGWQGMALYTSKDFGED
ncbi:hypothetical protein G7Y89_g4152 [Cudoniella acicularis]|uniref:Uncharacterized protein n=1 Tax=Cudoniella acicularis TaxID=354080 RepID=A0A8H4RR98_9HELO|nr:hypothetical protein G7Y89_g4152 [Cudoniella acicularis]